MQCPFIVDSWEIFGSFRALKGFQFSSSPTQNVELVLWDLMSLNPSLEEKLSLSRVSSWRGAVNLLTWITHSSWTTDQSGPSIQVTWPVSTNGRPGLVHDTPLSPGLEIMFSKFSHDIQWFEYSGKWRLLEANLNGQIIGLSNFFHRKLLHSGVLRVNLSNFS